MSESASTHSGPSGFSSHPLPSPSLVLIDEPIRGDADVLIVGHDEGESLSPTLQSVNELLGGSVQGLIAAGKVSGKRGETTLLAGPRASQRASGGPTMLLIVGLGEHKQADRNLAFESSALAMTLLIKKKHDRIDNMLAESFSPEDHDAIVAGAIAALERQPIYQAEPKHTLPKTMGFGSMDDQAIRRGEILGHSLNQTKRLVNEPPAMIYPESFAARAGEIADEVGLEIEVWDEKRLESEGCRAILAVGAGSTRPPRLVMLRHNGGGDEPPLALVGKGVTFDSGGLSLKTSEGMIAMKCDMAGAATVLGVMHALAKLGVKRNVIGFCGLAENMVSGSSYKLGDVIHTRSGKTIEILNTDAEGRVVLADTLDVAIEHQPRAMVDLATLTGACMVALGREVTGLMTNDQALCDAILAEAEKEGEPAWQLPMFSLYDDKVKSKVADIKNVGDARWGGAITAAKFLEQFVGETPWVHCDIAGPAFADSPLPHRDAGATGVMVRTLIRWIESTKT